jgi:hypothetical protein
MEKTKKEEYGKRLDEYNKRIRDKEILKFIDFLKTLFDWVGLLVEKKRIAISEEGEVFAHMPAKIFEEIDEMKSLGEVSKKYIVLKEILLKETKEFIRFIIKSFEIKVQDFDPLQFNLQQIFVKEEITMMMEWARMDLFKVIKEREERVKGDIEMRNKGRAEFFNELEKMPQREINKLIVASMFDFSPRARTDKERKEAIKNNRRKMENSRKNAEAFTFKLMDATEDAGEKAQMSVFRKTGEARLKLENVREKFRSKAKQIVSPDGPRKEIRKASARVLKARDRINEEKGNLRRDLSNAGKMFDRARKIMERKREKLDDETIEKRILIKKQAQAQLNLGKKIVDKAKVHLEEEKKDADILFEEGREHLKTAEKHMMEEKAGTEELFRIGRGNLAFAKTHLEDEKKGLEEKQDQARNIIYSMEERLKRERARGEKWVEREKKRIKTIEASLKKRRGKEQERLGLIKENLVKRGMETAEKSREKIRRRTVIPIKSNVLGEDSQKQAIIGKLPQKQEIENKFFNMKEKIKNDLEKKKGLIKYDLRFKRDELKTMAETQKEFMSNKLEAFQEKQRTLITRYRAKRKANMIRTLLKAMRTMK